MTETTAGVAPQQDLTLVVTESVIARRRRDIQLLPEEQAILYLLGGRGPIDTQPATPQEISEIESRVPDLTVQVAYRDALPRNSFSVPSPDDERVDQVAQRLQRLELVGLIAGLAIFESDGELVKRDALEVSVVSLLINHPDYNDIELDAMAITDKDESDQETAGDKGAKLMSSLSEMEQKVAKLWHKSSPNMAEELFIEDSTVRSHRVNVNIKAKNLGLTDDTVAVALFESGDLDISRERIERLVKKVEPLSGRQLDCFRLQIRGMTYEDIGRELSISPSTVRVHLHNTSKKLGGRNSRENAIIAHCSELVDFVL